MNNLTMRGGEQSQHPSRTEEEQSDKPGTQGGSDERPDAPAPFAPDSDEDSALGDTDEHSDA